LRRQVEEGCHAVASAEKGYPRDWLFESCVALSEIPRWYENDTRNATPRNISRVESLMRMMENVEISKEGCKEMMQSSPPLAFTSTDLFVLITHILITV